MNKIENFFDELAPNWDQMESHTLEEKRALLDLVGIKKGDLCLDAACGTGVITGLIHEYSQNDVLGVDLSQKMIMIAKEKYQNDQWACFLQKDLLTLELNEQFDVIIIYNAYPHFLDPARLALKLYTLLKPQGRFAIMHSLSRQELAMHHKGRADQVSRTIKAPLEEASYFNDYFKIVKTLDGEHSYLLVGEKTKE